MKPGFVVTYSGVVCVTALILQACSGGVHESSESWVFEQDFHNAPDADAVEFGFADYPAGDEGFYELDAGWEEVPGLGGRKGLFLSGHNHSDDLFMFVKSPVRGLPAEQRFDVHMELDYATNVGQGCVGIGGSPGESVVVKMGVMGAEPMAVDRGDGYLIMNIDKGNQSNAGSDALVLGDMAGSRRSCDESQVYEIKSETSQGQAFVARSDESGVLWLLAGTDSGFEGRSRIYLLRFRVALRER